MACQRSLVILLFVLLAVSIQLCSTQHWSHGWYPGGKRELAIPQTPEVSEEIKLCDGEECTYLRSPRKSILKEILADIIAWQIQKKK
ncbi:progonadoliberin-2 [Latimeria chalumnae]|uniref:Progonadoliberin n=2 Tax=Latimeria TaxID=7896 RepID=H3ANV9_LATCH|nr:PREDICTED: progonadoliberin-2 [Latimeria chalumnae]ABZ04537.1 gonadotropin-releasing hormone 2 [Latimeria menadoensis]|eukprot:XP_006006072.1 PREDICTED: progonadoliberin-2 [Latimeria chalumnae]